jgi:diguanylate cyclase (GGDEF)-like protein/PAS domain S-box-containing protein
MSELNNPEVFRSVLEHLGTGVYLVDRNRKIVFWNEGAESITGHLRQDVVGRFLREHLLALSGDTKDIESDTTDPLNLVFRDGKPSITAVSILHKEGHRVPIVLRTIPIRNSHGAVIGAAESFDINLSAPGQTRRRAATVERGCLDEVAGVPGQSFMETRLAEMLASFAQHHTPFSILITQVSQMDHFVRTFGPGVVPSILRVIARTIENSLRPNDLVGCWSENRFMAALSECKEGEVERVGDRIRKMIGNSEIEWWGDTFPVAATLGEASVRPGDTLELLVARAEKSLLESVVAGGNRVTVLT